MFLELVLWSQCWPLERVSSSSSLNCMWEYKLLTGNKSLFSMQPMEPWSITAPQHQESRVRFSWLVSSLWAVTQHRHIENNLLRVNKRETAETGKKTLGPFLTTEHFASRQENYLQLIWKRFGLYILDNILCAIKSHELFCCFSLGRA